MSEYKPTGTWFDHLDDYRRGTLTPEMRVAMEVQLSSDAALRSELEARETLAAELRAGMTGAVPDAAGLTRARTAVLAQLRSEAKAGEAAVSDVRDVVRPTTSAAVASSNRQGGRGYPWIAVAASFAVGCVLTAFLADELQDALQMVRENRGVASVAERRRESAAAAEPLPSDSEMKSNNQAGSPERELVATSEPRSDVQTRIADEPAAAPPAPAQSGTLRMDSANALAFQNEVVPALQGAGADKQQTGILAPESAKKSVRFFARDGDARLQRSPERTATESRRAAATSVSSQAGEPANNPVQEPEGLFRKTDSNYESSDFSNASLSAASLGNAVSRSESADAGSFFSKSASPAAASAPAERDGVTFRSRLAIPKGETAIADERASTAASGPDGRDLAFDLERAMSLQRQGQTTESLVIMQSVINALRESAYGVTRQSLTTTTLNSDPRL